jgi:hypothetical protein
MKSSFKFMLSYSSYSSACELEYSFAHVIIMIYELATGATNQRRSGVGERPRLATAGESTAAASCIGRRPMAVPG